MNGVEGTDPKIGLLNRDSSAKTPENSRTVRGDRVMPKIDVAVFVVNNINPKSTVPIKVFKHVFLP